MNHPRKVISRLARNLFFPNKKNTPPQHSTLRLANGASLSTTELNVSPESRKFATQNSGGEDFQLHAIKINNFGSVFSKRFWQLVGWIVCQVGWVMLVRQFDVKLHFLKLTASLLLKIGEKTWPPPKKN